MEKNHSKEFDETMGLIDINNLRYEASESVVATQSCNRNICNFNPSSYPLCQGSEQPSVLLNVGSSYVDGMKSMLQFTMTVNIGSTGTAKYFAFGNNVARAADGCESYNSGGSVLNLFSEINHQSKSGDLLYRELYKNQTRTSRLYKIDKSRRGYLGTMGGAQEVNGSLKGILKFPIFPVNEAVTFEVPLGELCSFWATGQLIPPQLLSGSLLRLTLAPIASALVFYDETGEALVTANTGLTTISLQNMLCYLHQSELYDSVNSLLLASAASAETNGLQYCYNTEFNTIVNPSGPSFAFDIQLSCAKMSYLVLKFVPKDPWTGVVLDNAVVPKKLDPFAACNIRDYGDITNANALPFSIQVRLGNMVMPLFPINTATDIYQQTCNALNPISYSGADAPDPLKTLNKLMAGTLSFSEYSKVNVVSNVAKLGAGTGGCIFAFSFERSSAVNIGGLSSNNARVLSVEVNNMTNAAQMQCIASVTYLQIANVSNENIVINK